MAERLERLIVSERRLLGDISHELRSPLARLKFAVKLARTSQDNQAALDRIERDIDRITSLVADIVEITFIEGDPAVQDTGIVRAGEIIDEVVRDCALEAQFRDCSIDVGGKLTGELLGSHELLRRAIENVLRNGIRYSPKRSAIQLTLQKMNVKQHYCARLWARRSEDAVTRIFDPFFRVEDARDTMAADRAWTVHCEACRSTASRNYRAENASSGLRVRIIIPLAVQPGVAFAQVTGKNNQARSP